MGWVGGGGEVGRGGVFLWWSEKGERFFRRRTKKVNECGRRSKKIINGEQPMN